MKREESNGSLIDCPFCGAPPCKLNIAHYGDVVTCGGTDSWCAGKDLRVDYDHWNRRPQPSEIRDNMDVAESSVPTAWTPPRQETIGHWKKYRAISRRDWVGVLTLLESYLCSPEPVSRELQVLKNVIRFADGRCWPEAQAAIDANRSIIESKE